MNDAWDAQVDSQIKRAEEAIGSVVARSGVGAIDYCSPLRNIEELEREQEEARAMAKGLRSDQIEDVQAALDAMKTMARLKGMDQMLADLFVDGWHPAMVMRRLYGFVIQRRPDLVHGMNRADAASMFGETRAAFQERMRLMFMGRSGMRSRTQKMGISVERMRESARGNHNRKNGAKKKLILKNATQRAS